MTTPLFLLGSTAGALLASLWHGRARFVGEFRARIGGMRDMPIVTMAINNVTYVLTQDEAVKIADAPRGVVEKQRATQTKGGA